LDYCMYTWLISLLLNVEIGVFTNHSCRGLFFWKRCLFQLLNT